MTPGFLVAAEKQSPDMSQNRTSYLLIAVFLLISLLYLYFFFFPTVISSFFNNILVVIATIALFALLVYLSQTVQNSAYTGLILFAIVMVAILARAVPHIRLPYPILNDPLRYYVSAANIIEYETLVPHLDHWYPDIAVHLRFPVMFLISAFTEQITGISLMWLARFQEPILGGLASLVIFALAREITRSNHTALIATLLITLSDLVIFYQSEYHPQGMAFLMFVVLLYSYIKSLSVKKIAFRLIAMLALASIVLTHHYSSIFIAILALSIVAINIVLQFLSKIKAFSHFQKFVLPQEDNTFWMIVAAAGFLYQVFVYNIALLGFSRQVKELTPQYAYLILTDAPFIKMLLNASKWLILILGTVSIIEILRRPETHKVRILIITLCIIASGIFGNYAVRSPLDRIIAFYIPSISILAALTVGKMYSLSKVSLRLASLLKPLTVLLIALFLAANFFNYSYPALFLKDTSYNKYYWYYNYLLPAEYHKAAGEWAGKNISEGKTTAEEQDTSNVAFFFGRRRQVDTFFAVNYPLSVDYAIVNPSLEYEGASYTKPQLDRSLNKIYTNGKIAVYSHVGKFEE